MDIAKFDGININYRFHHHGHDKTIAFVSGFSCDHKIWALIVANLGSKFNLLVFDNRGIGLTTDNNMPFNIKTMAQDLYLLIDYLKISRVSVVGHSMGGVIAQQFAIDYAEYIDKLVILNSGICSFKTLEYALSNQNLFWYKYSPDPVDLMKLNLPWLFSNHFLENTEYIQAFINTVISNPTPQSIFDNKRQLDALIYADLRDTANAINCSTLAIGSEDDLLTPAKITKEITNYIKNSQFISIPGGHASIIEHPDIISKILIDFL